MRWWHGVTVWALLAATGVPAPASIFSKRTKPNPNERVPQLIVTVKTDTDEGKRAAAAGELRQFDPNAFPEIVPVLIDVLKNDPKPSVRSEAAQSLSRLRPISQDAGAALEQAASKDAALRVRWQARSALMHYHLGGYHKGKNTPPPTGPILDPRTEEPPLAPGYAKTLTGKVTPPSGPSGANAGSSTPTVSTPTVSTPTVNDTTPRPLPPGPVQGPTVPVEPPQLKTPPPSGPQGSPF